MIKKSIKFGFSALLLASFTSCQSSSTKNVPSSWKGRMQVFSQLAADLYPIAMNDETFKKNQYDEEFTERLNTLGTLAADLSEAYYKGDIKGIDKDPAIGFIAKKFSNDISLAAEALQTGKVQYAQYFIKKIPRYCIQCHSRGQYGPSFSKWPDSADFNTLNPMQKAQLYTAIRRHDLAIVQYKKVFSEANDPDRYGDWEQILKQSLNFAIRQQQDLQLAESFLTDFIQAPKSSTYLKSVARAWKKSIQQLKSVKASQFSQLEYAKNLLKKANDKKSFWGDPSTFIYYLQASAVAHNSIRSQPKTAPDAYFLLGQIYEAIDLEETSGLNEYYYKLCIVEKPHSELSAKCFDRFEASVHLGFARPYGMGSAKSNVYLLENLRNQAKPKK